MDAMRLFFDDFDQGLRDGRYLDAALPALPFADDTFELAVCSHFLFLYGGHVDEAFHLAAVRELCRVAREVRIFPLLGLDGSPCPYVEGVGATKSAGEPPSPSNVSPTNSSAAAIRC